jgi:hypothetical protein
MNINSKTFYAFAGNQYKRKIGWPYYAAIEGDTLKELIEQIERMIAYGVYGEMSKIKIMYVDHDVIKRIFPASEARRILKLNSL